jgi:disintegrin and metalloproteinase domain-containing protein 17
MKLVSFVLVWTTTFFVLTTALSDLSKNLRYYETLHKSELSHSIVKRGANPSNHKFNQIREIDFKALGRNFRLILSPKKGLLSPTFKAVELDDEDKEIFVPIDHESFYDGRVFGETQSRAQALLWNRNRRNRNLSKSRNRSRN